MNSLFFWGERCFALHPQVVRITNWFCLSDGTSELFCNSEVIFELGDLELVEDCLELVEPRCEIIDVV